MDKINLALQILYWLGKLELYIKKFALFLFKCVFKLPDFFFYIPAYFILLSQKEDKIRIIFSTEGSNIITNKITIYIFMYWEKPTLLSKNSSIDISNLAYIFDSEKFIIYYNIANNQDQYNEVIKVKNVVLYYGIINSNKRKKWFKMENEAINIPFNRLVL